MVGMKASERSQSESAKTLVRACLDHVELLVRQSENVKAAGDVEATLTLLNRAAAELQADEASSPAVVSSLRNAVGRLQALKAEMVAK